MKVMVVGVGMGNVGTLTVAAKGAIEGSALLVGSARLLEPWGHLGCERRALVKPDEIADALNSARDAGAGQASVLLSGDVGFYSGAAALHDKLDGFEVEVFPGVSSVAYFCAKLRTPWQDAALVSAHGREHDAAGAVQANAKTFCITGGATRVQDICRDLTARGLGEVRVAAGERLSYADERIVQGSAAELAEMDFADLSVMLALNPRPVKRPFAAPSLADEDFQRGRAPMTKGEVRALAIAKLRIAENHTVWDVGAGTGSVSVEAALAARQGRVYAVEKDSGACALLRANREEAGASNVEVVEGEAPGILASLPAPDRVFVGGTSGKLQEVLDAARAANPHVRICATAVTLETLADLLAYAKGEPAAQADIVQVSIARAEVAGDYRLMRAQNPVYLATLDFDEK